MLDEMLTAYSGKLGLGTMINQDVTKYLNITQEQLAKMSPDECMEAAFLLEREALFLQQEINNNQAQIDWITIRIKKTITADVANYGGKYTPYEDRAVLAIKGNSYAAELDAKANKAKLNITKLNYIPTHLKNIAATLTKCSFSKRGVNHETSRSS